MEIKQLEFDKIAQYYSEVIYEDFPAAEIKPVQIVNYIAACGSYKCLQLCEGESVLAYAFLCEGKDEVLLDYFAVLGENKGKGYGSSMLKSMLEIYKDKNFLLEIEALDTFESLQDMEKRIKRASFYHKNGLKMTDVVCTPFGVRFFVLQSKDNSNEEVLSSMEKIYKSMVLDFKKNVKLEINAK